MAWRMHVLILIALFSVIHAKEEKKTALIITLDELKPEESDAIISDLTIKEQRNLPTYLRNDNSALHKPLEYILVRPEDLNALRNLNGVTVEKPRFVKHPDSSSSGEIYETDGYSKYPEEKKSYSINAGYPRSPISKYRSGISKYPSRPAPPLAVQSGGDSSKEERDPNNLPHDSGYDSPNNSELNSYTGPSSYSAPASSYGSSKPSYSGTSSHSSPGSSKSSSYSGPSSYGSTKPSSYSDNTYTGIEKPPSYSVPSSYSQPSYESSKPNSYSGPSYGTSKPNSYSGPSSYVSSEQNNYSGPSSYGSSKPSSYSGPSSYGSSKPSSYAGSSSYSSPKPNSHSPPSSYGSSKPNSYSGPSSYGSSKPNSYSPPSTYENTKPNSYSPPSTYENTKPNSYVGHSTYGSSKPGTSSNYEKQGPSSYSAPPTYGGSKPSSYSDTSSYSGPGSSYGKSKPSSYTTTSGHSDPGSSKSHYSDPSSDYSSNSPPSDLSSEKYYPNTEKYHSHPESYDHPEKPYYDDYHAPNPSIYDTDSHYNPSQSYEPGHYDSPSVTVEPAKYISYGDFAPPATAYDPPHSGYSDDSPYDTNYRNTPPKKNYIVPTSYNKDVTHVSYDSLPPSNSGYGKKLHDTSSSSDNYKPRTPYDSKFHTDSYSSPKPVRPYSKKQTYTSLKTSYGAPQDPSSHEEPVQKYTKQHYPPSYKVASEVAYVPPSSSSYSSSYPRSPLPTLKEGSETSSYDHSALSKPKYESGYYSSYSSPPTDDTKYSFNPISTKHGSQYEDSSQTDGDIPSRHYENHSSYPTHSNVEYGSRYPSTYRKTRHTDLKINHPANSDYNTDDVRSPDHKQNYQIKNPQTGVKESHSHYHHFHDDSSESPEIPDNHSAKKNYSPVRPAPIHDELEQPRYPPLPRRSKNNKKYYESDEVHSKENNENYKPQPSYTNTKSYNPSSYDSEYRDSFNPSHTHSKTQSKYPTSDEDKNYHYSDHSSEETDDEPKVYTKTTTTTYTKPFRSGSTNHGYSSDSQSKNEYKPPITSYPRTRTYNSKANDFVPSQPEFSRPSIHRGSQKIAGSSSNSKPYISEAKSKESIGNATLPITYSSLSEILPPKRVEGVVYRYRQSYPHVKELRRYKGYLPYKPHLSKNNAYDHKHYESLPSEISQKNVTKDRPRYVLSEKDIKPKNVSPRKHERYSSQESSEEYEDSSDNSNLDAIPGEPEKDYPILKEIPHNRYSCENKHPGFYADVESRCQVYYQCGEQGRMQSFLCPNGTIFNQQTFVCEWWHNVNCAKSEEYFSKNNLLYKAAPSTTKNKRTANEKYTRHLRPELHANTNLQSFYAEDSEEFNRRKNGRRRNKFTYVPKNNKK